jgi:K+-sensing histidine kinase KdpD
MERARLYANEQAARAVAEEANHLKTQFLAMVSHELRTPLTSIIGFITTLLSDDVKWSETEQQSFLEVINEESQKLKELVEQLLDVSRLQAGMLSIHPSKQTVQTILSTAAAQLDALTVHHKLMLDVPDDLPPILADEQRIAQVLVNLVDNAAKYSPPETRITISAQLYDHSVQFSVSDEGKGIPSEAYHQVFEAFHQLGRDSVPEKGVGLGLAICKALIEAHGGKIWIEGSGRSGTTISFTLPTASGEPLPASPT